MCGRRWIAVQRSTDGIVSAVPCILRGFTVRTTTAEGSLLLYDNASAASGTIVGDVSMDVDKDSIAVVPLNVRCEKGLYANLTTANIVVYFELEY